MARPSAARDRWILAAVQTLVLLPFLGKAFHIDDAFFLAIAEHILQQPTQPYDFHYNWTGERDWVWSEMKNPPLVFYLQALLIELGGAGERWLHGAFLLFPHVASQALYSLARRVSAAPLYACLLLVVCPAYWVSATSLMIDVPLIAAMLLAVASLARAADGGGVGARIAAGAAASAAVLAKYFGLALLPLLLAQGWLQDRARLRSSAAARRRAWLALLVPIVLPVLAFAAWTWASDGHVLGAFTYRSEDRFAPLRLATRAVVAASFSGGLLVFPVACWVSDAIERERRGFALLCGGFAAAALSVRFAWFPAAPHPLNDALLALWCGGSLAFVIRSFGMPFDKAPASGEPGAHATGPGSEAAAAQTALRRIVLLWLAGGLAFAAFVNWTVNARTVLLYAAPAALVFAWQSEGRARLRTATLVATALAGLVVTLADAELAEFGRAEPARLRASLPGAARIRFVGHWGFQRYMEAAGFEHVELSRPRILPGDIVAIPEMHRIASRSLETLPPPVAAVEWQVRARRIPVAVMSGEAGAALHGSFLGHLPWAVTRAPLERVEILRW